MKISLIIIAALAIPLTVPHTKKWRSETHGLYNLIYCPEEKNEIQEYQSLVDKGIEDVKVFFDAAYTRSFDVIVHHNRASLDSAWQINWKLPDFKSECWMVASGTASRLDMLAPKVWDLESCEHKYADQEKTQQLITHELVHVFHGQHNPDPEFENVEGVDWLVEGLAVYVSGQCDSLQILEIKSAVSLKKAPQSLDKFWTGKLKYGLSGSLVMYIDKKIGREELKKLLPLTKKSQVLEALGTDEKTLLAGWEKYLLTL